MDFGSDRREFGAPKMRKRPSWEPFILLKRGALSSVSQTLRMIATFEIRVDFPINFHQVVVGLQSLNVRAKVHMRKILNGSFADVVDSMVG